MTSTLLRRWRTYTSTMFVNPSKLSSQTCSMIMVRENTAAGVGHEVFQKRVFLGGEFDALPARLTCCDRRSISGRPHAARSRGSVGHGEAALSLARGVRRTRTVS